MTGSGVADDAVAIAVPVGCGVSPGCVAVEFPFVQELKNRTSRSKRLIFRLSSTNSPISDCGISMALSRRELPIPNPDLPISTHLEPAGW